MTDHKQIALHHASHAYGSGVETLDFEIRAHKRYDERKKPLRRSRYGERRPSIINSPLRRKEQKPRKGKVTEQ